MSAPVAKFQPIPKQPDGDAMLLDFTGGLRAWKVEGGYWHFGPVLHESAPMIKGPIPHNELTEIVAKGELKAVGFNSIHWDGGVFSSSWKAVLPNEVTHHVGAADLWHRISTNLKKIRTEDFLKRLDKSTPRNRIPEVLDDGSDDENISHFISISLRNMDTCIRDMSAHYHYCVTRLLINGQYDLEVSTSTDVNLYAYVQTFFMQLGAVRDYLAMFIACRCGLDHSRIDSMARLLEKLKSSSIPDDKILNHIIDKNIIIPSKTSTKMELSGWLQEASDARNTFIHRRPYGSRHIEKYGRLIKLNAGLGIYKYERGVVLPDGKIVDVFEYICGHYRNCVQMFFDCAHLSGHDASVITITDKDIIFKDTKES